MGMNALVLLLTLTSTLLLRSGDRIAVEGKPVEKDGVVTFRSGGVLYSMPAIEVARIDNEEPATTTTITVKPVTTVSRRPVVSEEERKRLLAELEQNHGGTTPPPPPQSEPVPTRAEVREQKREEAEWRREARAHEEAIRQANEELALLETRVADLRAKIHSLLSIGYKPHQFTYDTSQLELTLTQIPYAQLAVTRAIRAFDQFREDARREGVMPGWLR
jgi:type IV secretory pathway VirB10-like protein